MFWTWCLDGGPRRVNHAAVTVDKTIYSFGGYCTGDDHKDFRKPIDVFVLSPETNRWGELTSPEVPEWLDVDDLEWPYQRYGHTVSAYGNLVLLFGGRNDLRSCNGLFVFDTTLRKWSRPKTTGEIPPERDGHSACVINNALYIYGGYEEEMHQFGKDVYRLDLRAMEWTRLKIKGARPAFRDFHTATAIGDCMYIFGGRSDRQWELGGSTNPGAILQEYYTNKLTYLDTRTLTWHSPTVKDAPQGRRSHSAINFQDKLLIFGGYNSELKEHMNDMWLYDPVSSKWEELHPRGIGPEPRRRHAMCQYGNKLFVFGGTSPYLGPPILYTEEQLSRMTHLDYVTMTNSLIDHNDLFVLDLSPSLKTLCLMAVLENGQDQSELPPQLIRDIELATCSNTISKPLPIAAPLPLG